MRLYTFVTLCACALYVRAASIPSSEKKIDDLDNVDLDNVEPELVDQPTVQDVDNNLRKASVILVKVVEEPVVLDETSNDYVPSKDESSDIKRLEIDLNNPGPPQRQEHETQNPENYGERERAVSEIIQKTKEAHLVFTKGLKDIYDSFQNLKERSDEFPVILENIKNLNESFGNEIQQLNGYVKNHLESQVPAEEQSKKESQLKMINTNIKNLEVKFNAGINTLTEGIELLSIIHEGDVAEKLQTKGLIKQGSEAAKDTAPSSTSAPPFQFPNLIFTQYLGNFSTSISNALSNFTSVFQNPISNFFQSINLPRPQGNKPPSAQSDEVVSAPTPAPWGPQALFQQVQSSIQNFITPGQNNQQNQQPPAPGPIAQTIQNIMQFIQRPQQQPNNPNPAPEKVPENQSTPPKQPEKDPEVQADAVPPVVPASSVVPTPGKVEQPAAEPQAASAPQAVAEQPAQAGPIQQLVQNNPIIKGIQSAVQRIQGNPGNSETPRNELIKDEKKEEEPLENKGHYGGNNVNNANQGGDNISSGLSDKVEEPKEKPVEAASDIGVKAEEMKILASSDKTE